MLESHANLCSRTSQIARQKSIRLLVINLTNYPCQKSRWVFIRNPTVLCLKIWQILGKKSHISSLRNFTDSYSRMSQILSQRHLLSDNVKSSWLSYIRIRNLHLFKIFLNVRNLKDYLLGISRTSSQQFDRSFVRNLTNSMSVNSQILCRLSYRLSQIPWYESHRLCVRNIKDSNSWLAIFLRSHGLFF